MDHGKGPFKPSYDAAIRYLDKRIMRMYHYFYECYDHNLIFIVTSDHGRA